MPRLGEDRRRAVLGPMREECNRPSMISPSSGSGVENLWLSGVSASDLLLLRLASFQSVEGGGSGAVLCGWLHLCLPLQYYRSAAQLELHGNRWRGVGVVLVG